MNTVALMGRIVNDLELKTVGKDTPMLNFTIAVDRDFVAQGKERQTDFFDCTAWRQNAEFISKYFSKGRMIAITGSLQTNSYETNDGVKRKYVNIVVDRANFCGDKARDGGSGSNTTTKSKPAKTVDDYSEDELPF